MEIELEVTGCRELATALRSLSVEVQDKFMPVALKEGAQIICGQAAVNAPHKSGDLADSMTVSARGGTVLVGPDKATYSDKRKMRHSTIGLFQEKGTENHFNLFGSRIKSNAYARMKKKSLIFLAKSEQRMPARPFLQPALEARAQDALNRMAEKLRELIEARFKKGA